MAIKINKLKSPYYQCEFMIDGKRYTKSTGCVLKKEAEKFEEKYKKEIKAKLVELGENNITLEDAIKLISKAKPPEARMFGYILNWITDEKKLLKKDDSLSQLSSAMLNKIALMREEEGKKPATVRIFVGRISRMLQYCEAHGYKIADNIKPPKIKVANSQDVFFSPEQEQAIFDALDYKRPIKNAPPYQNEPHHRQRVAIKQLHDLWLTLMDTGCRLQEAAAIQWKNVDFENNTIKIWRSKTKKPGVVHISDRLKEILIQRQKDNFQKSIWVFPNSDNTNHQKYFTNLRSILKRAGIEEGSIHTARHTFASRLGQSGEVQLHTISQALGHSSIQQTMRYAHTIPAETALRAASVINALNAKNEVRVNNNNQNSYVNSSVDGTQKNTYAEQIIEWED